MNYGYNRECDGWNEDRKDVLADALSFVVSDYTDCHDMKPYVEVDGLYKGVRIRRMTHLTDEQYRDLITRADALYDQVMKPS